MGSLARTVIVRRPGFLCGGHETRAQRGRRYGGRFDDDASCQSASALRHAQDECTYAGLTVTLSGIDFHNYFWPRRSYEKQRPRKGSWHVCRSSKPVDSFGSGCRGEGYDCRNTKF